MNKMDEALQVYTGLQQVLLDIVKDVSLRDRYKELMEEFTKAIQPIRHECELCPSTYIDYILPLEWWNKLPEEYRSKLLCFGCYMYNMKE